MLHHAITIDIRNETQIYYGFGLWISEGGGHLVSPSVQRMFEKKDRTTSPCNRSMKRARTG